MVLLLFPWPPCTYNVRRAEFWVASVRQTAGGSRFIFYSHEHFVVLLALTCRFEGPSRSSSMSSRVRPPTRLCSDAVDDARRGNTWRARLSWTKRKNNNNNVRGVRFFCYFNFFFFVPDKLCAQTSLQVYSFFFFFSFRTKYFCYAARVPRQPTHFATGKKVKQRTTIIV